MKKKRDVRVIRIPDAVYEAIAEAVEGRGVTVSSFATYLISEGWRAVADRQKRELTTNVGGHA